MITQKVTLSAVSCGNCGNNKTAAIIYALEFLSWLKWLVGSVLAFSISFFLGPPDPLVIETRQVKEWTIAVISGFVFDGGRFITS